MTSNISYKFHLNNLFHLKSYCLLNYWAIFQVCTCNGHVMPTTVQNSSASMSNHQTALQQSTELFKRCHMFQPKPKKLDQLKGWPAVNLNEFNQQGSAELHHKTASMCWSWRWTLVHAEW